MGLKNQTMFAPVPIRAIDFQLTALELRMLVVVAAHDRLSEPRGKGHGCVASNKRLAALAGCDYTRACAALSKLCKVGLLRREKRGRSTVYRVIYNDEDTEIFMNQKREPKTCDGGGAGDEITCKTGLKNTGNPLENGDQYIPLSGEKDFVETTKQIGTTTLNETTGVCCELGNLRVEFGAIEQGFSENWTCYREHLPELLTELDSMELSARQGGDILLAERICDTKANVKFMTEYVPVSAACG